MMSEKLGQCPANPPHRGTVLWFTGLSGSGKTTIAKALAGYLEAEGKRVHTLDGDFIRSQHNRHLGFSREDIRENNRSTAELAKRAAATHDVVLVPIISPYVEDRAMARSLIGEGFIELYVSTPLELCVQRDVKGLYTKPRRGEITNLIGFHPESPYEAPTKPDIEVQTADMSLDDIVMHVAKTLCID